MLMWWSVQVKYFELRRSEISTECARVGWAREGGGVTKFPEATVFNEVMTTI